MIFAIARVDNLGAGIISYKDKKAVLNGTPKLKMYWYHVEFCSVFDSNSIECLWSSEYNSTPSITVNLEFQTTNSILDQHIDIR